MNNYIDLTDYISSLSNRNNVFIKDIILIIVFFFSTISFLGVIIQSIIIGVEGISIGYILCEFYLNYKFKGLLFGIINLLINKFFFLLLLFYLFYITYKYSIKIINNMIGNSNDYVKSLIKPIINKYLVISSFLIIFDLAIYYFGNLILNKLSFVL